MQEDKNIIELFEQLSEKQCTKDEILAMIDIDEVILTSIIEKHYGTSKLDNLLNKLQQRGKAQLRLQQFDMAKSATTMAVWLGKQYLGQVNTPSSTAANTNDFSELDSDIFNDKCD